MGYGIDKDYYSPPRETCVAPYFRVYRRVLRNPRYPAQEGRAIWIEDVYGAWWSGAPTLAGVLRECRYAVKRYADCGVAVSHTVAVHRGWTVEYVDVPSD